METYKQPIKELSRKLIWQHAVSSLTQNRINIRVLKPNYMDNLWEYCNDILSTYCPEIKLDGNHYEDWKKYSNIVYRNKKAEQLKVAFFCGPEPDNDVTNLLRLGVRLENIYAFENNKICFSSAVKSLHDNYPQMKIFNGKIEDFASLNSVMFDIIYLDFTGSLFTEFRTIFAILDSNVLSEQCIFAVNTSYPDITPENVDNLASYVLRQSMPEYKSLFGDDGDGYGYQGYAGIYTESYEYYGFQDSNEFKEIIKKNFNNVYSSFQTHSILDYAVRIKPAFALVNCELLKKRLFCSDIENVLSKGENYNNMFVSHIIANKPLLSYRLEAIASNKWIDFFTKTATGGKCNRINSVKLMEFFRNAPYEEFKDVFSDVLAENLEKINANTIDNKYGGRFFCDVPMIHLWLEMLFYQQGYPYHHNSENHRRYSYTAKKHRMCLDIFTFDRCRAFYDWLPILEYYAEGMNVVERQIISRMCMDAINKHSIYVMNDLYSGTALVGINEYPWSRNKTIALREDLNKNLS